MLHEDWIVFALLLCKIHLRGFSGEPNFETEFDHFLRGKEGMISGQSALKVEGLTAEQLEACTALIKLPAFKAIQSKLSSASGFKDWLNSSSPEDNIYNLWDDDKLLTPVGTSMHQLLVIQALRPDRTIAMCHSVVKTVLGQSFLDSAATELDLAAIVENEIKATNPVLMCSVPGFDASGRVDDMAAELGKNLTPIAMGSAEGFAQAEKVINSSSKTGKWVMLKNVHLAPQWLVQLEKKLHTLNPHPSFRLFLTLEIHPKIPVNLLRAGRTFVFEPPPGIKANLLRTFNTIPASRMMKAPNERSRLYFLLGWFHAIVQERLRYSPLGWSKKYEFNESDLKVACDTLDTWIDATAMGRTNLSPEKVPWDAMRILLGQCIYGGKIDNEFDQRLLTSFLNKLFTMKSFETDFVLVDNVTGLDSSKDVITMPEGIRRDQFLHWTETLSGRQTPSWLGLPDNAEKVLLTHQTSCTISKLLKLQMLEDDEDQIIYTETEQTGDRVQMVVKRRTSETSDGRPAWMRMLLNSTVNWLRLLPPSLPVLRRTVDNIKDPLYRFFEREVNSASRLLDTVRHDLNDVVLICKGEKKQTNHHRLLLADLAKGIIPSHWKIYTIPQGSTVIQWITDFTDRVTQLHKISSTCAEKGAAAMKSLKIWLGGLFNPEAYITATRQYVAQTNGWSLEELSLVVEILDGNKETSNDYSFGITGKDCRLCFLIVINTLMFCL